MSESREMHCCSRLTAAVLCPFGGSERARASIVRACTGGGDDDDDEERQEQPEGGNYYRKRARERAKNAYLHTHTKTPGAIGAHLPAAS